MEDRDTNLLPLRGGNRRTKPLTVRRPVRWSADWERERAKDNEPEVLNCETSKGLSGKERILNAWERAKGLSEVGLLIDLFKIDFTVLVERASLFIIEKSWIRTNVSY